MVEFTELHRANFRKSFRIDTVMLEIIGVSTKLIFKMLSKCFFFLVQ